MPVRPGVALFFVCLLPTLASCQVPSGNVFLGYSGYGRGPISSFSESGLQLMNGWEASAEGKVVPLLGIVGEVSQYFAPSPHCVVPAAVPVSGGTSYCGSLITDEENLLFGPRASASLGGVRPFGEALVGVAHAAASFGGGFDTSLAMAVGGGIDLSLDHQFAWRLQGDFVQTRLFGGAQNGFRISTGVVLRF